MCSNTAHENHQKINIGDWKADEITRLITENLLQVSQLKQKFVEEKELSKQNKRRVENEIKKAKDDVVSYVQTQMEILKYYETATLKILDEMLQKHNTENDEEMSESDIEESSTPPSDSQPQEYSLRKNRSNGKPTVDADKTRQVKTKIQN